MNKEKEYEKIITLFKPNNVFYSRDLHAIDIVNAILMSSKIDLQIKEDLNKMLYQILRSSDINFINEDKYGLFMINEPGWEEIIYKKGNFVTRKIYKYLIDNNLKDFIYNVKLSFVNKEQLSNFDLNMNMFIVLEDSELINDIEVLKRNGYYFNEDAVFKKEDYIRFLNSQIANHDGKTFVYINMFTGCIDDTVEIQDLLKNDPYNRERLKNIYIAMVFVQYTKYNMSKVTYYKNMRPCSFGVMNLFDQCLLNKININKVM